MAEALPFEEAHEQIEGHTLVSPDRCHVLFTLATQVRNLPGAAAEVGVYRGGTAKLLALAMPDKPLYLFDTFQGLPKTSAIDKHFETEFNDVSLIAVHDFLEEHHNAVLRPGFFPKSAEDLSGTKFSFAHFDGDLYQSAKDFIAFFYPRLVPGGTLVFDDYGDPKCAGVKQALDEAALPVFQSVPNQCYVKK